jgi:hypothetical protein
VASSSSDNDAYPPEWWSAAPKAFAPRATTCEPADDNVTAVAQYLADMVAQLESMAVAAKLELVAYLLAMARSEADTIARTRLGDAGVERR